MLVQCRKAQGTRHLVELLHVLPQIREVLEKFLDDDQDMKDMNLTLKEQAQQAAEAEVGREASLTPS